MGANTPTFLWPCLCAMPHPYSDSFEEAVCKLHTDIETNRVALSNSSFPAYVVRALRQRGMCRWRSVWYRVSARAWSLSGLHLRLRSRRRIPPPSPRRLLAFSLRGWRSFLPSTAPGPIVTRARRPWPPCCRCMPSLVPSATRLEPPPALVRHDDLSRYQLAHRQLCLHCNY